MASCKEHYDRLYAASGQVLGESFIDHRGVLQAKSHTYLHDISVWIEAIGERPESTAYGYAQREYQFALLALTLGHYRQAYSSLRLFLELMLNTIYLSTQEVELRIWLRRGRDTSWAALTHSESGVLGSRFVQAFLPDLSGEIGTYRGIAEKVYRECSEFVHGNINTHQKMPDQLKFDEPMFLEWHEKAKNCWMVISVALVTRYLSGLSKDAAKKIEHGTYDAIGHIEEIRAALESKQGE